jgi:hypothetical protein
MRNVELRISNGTSRKMTFYLEPWGGKYVIHEHRALRVVIEAPSSPVLEWETTDETQTLVVHDPAGTLATVFDGEHQVRAE